MPAQSKSYATSPLPRVTQRWRSGRHGLPRLLHTQTLSGACRSVSHAARSPQHETLARSDGLPAVCGGNGVGNGLPCPCDCAMSRRVSGSPSQPTTLQPHKSLLRYRHGIGHFTSSPWSMTANHGAQAHRASPPNTRWRSPRSFSFARAIRGISHALRASAIAWAAEEVRRARGRGVALLQDICTQRGSTDAAGAVGAARRREPMPEQGLHGTMTRHGAASLMTTSRLTVASRGTKGEGVTACDHCNLLQAARDCASAISTIDARTTIALEDGFCTYHAYSHNESYFPSF